jgi:exopolysaccharide biosynthesis polyprenyl glycosylphosphotransferase
MAIRLDGRITTLDDATSLDAARTPARAVPSTLVMAGLLVTDGLAVCSAFIIAYLTRFKIEWSILYTPPNSPLEFYSTLVFWLVPLILGVFAVFRLYSPRHLFDGPQEYAKIASATTMSIMLVVLLSFFFDSGLVISRGWIVISWVALLACVGANRFLMRRVIYALRRVGRLGQRVIVVGSGPDVADLVGRIREEPSSGLHVAAILEPHYLIADQPGEPSLNGVFSAVGANSVIVSAASVSQAELSALVRALSATSIDLQLVPGMHEILTTGVQVREIRGLPLVTMNKVRITGIDLVLKRALDCVLATLVLVLLSPLLLGIALAIRLTSPGPVFYRRRVIGQRGRPFEAFKFRTMHLNGDAILQRRPELAEELTKHGKLTNDPRVTSVGQWLRRWSLDEVPQLVNVLRGEMSLVGPRMISEAELPWFGHWRENLFTVQPGLTGLWQVSGRSQLGYDDRVRLDMHYIRNYSIWADMEILLRTIPAVVKGVGAY